MKEEDWRRGRNEATQETYEKEEKFVASAKKTAKCTFLTSTEATCLEEGGKANLSDGDTAWWQMAFCKRCQDAGGISNALYPSCAAQMPQD